MSLWFICLELTCLCFSRCMSVDISRIYVCLCVCECIFFHVSIWSICIHTFYWLCTKLHMYFICVHMLVLLCYGCTQIMKTYSKHLALYLKISQHPPEILKLKRKHNLTCIFLTYIWRLKGLTCWFMIYYCLFWSIFAHTGPTVLHPCNGPHHSEGICDGLLPHTDQRVQSPGLQLPQEPLRHCWCQVSLIFYTLCLNWANKCSFE